MAKRRVNARQLTPGQRTNLLIGRNAGGVGPGWAFENEDERKEAWAEHGEQLIDAAPPGRRPAAWWDYGEYEKLPHESDLQALDRLGLLTEAEIGYLNTYHPGALPTEPATGKDPREQLDKS